MKKLFLLLLIPGFSVTCFSQNEDSIFIKRISDFILVEGKSYDDLRYLTKKIGARLSGSDGMYKAEKWGLKTMQEAGADKAWLQECMVPHWVRGGIDEVTARSKSSKKKLDVLALGNSIGSDKPLIKQVIEIKNFGELDARKDLVKGNCTGW